MSTTQTNTTHARFEQVIPNDRLLSRVRAVLGHTLRERAFRALRHVPGARELVPGHHEQILHSNSRSMYSWYKAPFGTPDKPASLAEIPWDYVVDRQDEIPFLGLREYWYPALKSDELPHNEPVPVTLLGDNLVFFRGEDGAPCALENRCPHRSPLLSLGQVGVWKPGTITCRYHGMTFDGEGECVAFLADGPDSPACGRVKARAYAAREHGGIVWVYMGEREPPPLMESLPHGRGVLGRAELIVHRTEADYSYLNILDNTVDMTHVGCLHRTCVLFGDQKGYGEVGYEELEDGGLRAFYRDPGAHAGTLSIDEIRWYLPNLVYHGPGELGLAGHEQESWFWFVPRDVGSFVGWNIMGTDELRSRAAKLIMPRLMGFALESGVLPSVACFAGGDGPMQASQGRVVRWDQEKLTRTDRAVIRVRRMLEAAHRAEIAEREARGTQAQARRIHKP